MITLGIESTAHTFGIGIAENTKVVSNAFSTFTPPKGKGYVPTEMADHHASKAKEVLYSALKDAGLSLKDIDLFGVATGPGIGTTLKIGVMLARYLSSYFKKPIVGVNHAYAHMKVGELMSKVKNPVFLYVSGGNTQILTEKNGKVVVHGETLDIGVGNLFDSLARSLGLHSHGSALSSLAEGGSYIEMPYNVKGMNVAFSGMLTYAQRLIGREKAQDIAYSVMETAYAMLCEASERALYLTKRKGLVVCGGVAQSKRLRSMLSSMCKEDGFKFGFAPDEFNRDNGAMIALLSYLHFKKHGPTPLKGIAAEQNYRVEKVRCV
ncbi:MAG: tRNA (adenosine(37)-N6)-threonylcarbamoyltransferase complex transferase subunit TsaD [Candidatus Anstonellales archaeon]